MKIYDSSAEEQASAHLAQLGFVRCNTTFEQTFIDASSCPFRARPDFYHESAGLYVEYKPCKLNSRATKAIADNALAHAQAWAYDAYNHIKHGWSNSLFKQAAVQNVLTPQNFVVVFGTLPELKAARKYARYGVVFCTLGSLRTYVAYAKLRKIGIPVSFMLSYSEHSFCI